MEQDEQEKFAEVARLLAPRYSAWDLPDPFWGSESQWGRWNEAKRFAYFVSTWDGLPPTAPVNPERREQVFGWLGGPDWPQLTPEQRQRALLLVDGFVAEHPDPPMSQEEEWQLHGEHSRAELEQRLQKVREAGWPISAEGDVYVRFQELRRLVYERVPTLVRFLDDYFMFQEGRLQGPPAPPNDPRWEAVEVLGIRLPQSVREYRKARVTTTTT